MTTSDSDKPLKDHGSKIHWNLNDENSSEDQSERWKEQQALYLGMRNAEETKKRKRRKRLASRASIDVTGFSFDQNRPSTPPGERVARILGLYEADEDEGEHQVHELFCELIELKEDIGEMEWKETARWIRFEETVEEGGERWSKPHVAALSLHALFELRSTLVAASILLDLDTNSFPQFIELLIDAISLQIPLDTDIKEKIIDTLMTRHKHQHMKKENSKSGIPMIRSLADIGRKMSARNLNDKEKKDGLNTAPSEKTLGDSLQQGSNPKFQNSSADLENETSTNTKYNIHFLKKIPAGAEAANILVGSVQYLTSPISAFVRLQKAVLLGDLTEVEVPTRFIFVLLGPQGNEESYHEIGRCMATLMSDEIFHDVSYKSRERADILAGIDEFLDCVTVLPPGEWDPTIRIEPPKSVPSQEKRKKPTGPEGGEIANGVAQIEMEMEEHGDSTLIRTGKIFGGLIADIKRKAPFYFSDFTDAIHIQCVAAFFFMYFACLTPIITFGGLLGAATDNNIAAMESLISGCICGVTYHLFAGQPLTIIGSTGPVLVFESIVFNFCRDRDWNYLEFRFWIGMWMCLFLLIIVAFDLSSLVRYITRFTEESFAMLIAIIFIYEAFNKQIQSIHKYPVNFKPDKSIDYNCTCIPPSSWYTDPDLGSTPISFFDAGQMQVLIGNETYYWSELDNKKCKDMNGELVGSGCKTPKYIPDVFFFSCLIFIGTFALSYFLKTFRNTRFFPNKVRVLISDFAVFTAILISVCVDFLVGLKTAKLEVPEELRPTRFDRGWIVNPFTSRNPWYVIPAGIPPALFGTILIFMDQQITAVIVNRKEHKLIKGSGYHLDLLLITLQILLCTILGTPWFVAATVLSINHVRALTRESESSAPGERPKFLGVREQRVTGTLVFIMVGLSAFMANVLKFIPMSVLYGVFLFMGLSSLKGIQFVQRMLVLFMPQKYQPDYMFLRQVPLHRVHLFTFFQFLCLAGLCIIKEIKQISIIFPLMVVSMCFIRRLLDYVFTQHELRWLDDVSPESIKREQERLMAAANANQDNDDGAPQICISVPGSDNMTVVPPINISDEMAKTSIWKNIRSESELNMKADKKEEKPKKMSINKDAPVRFKIAADDEEKESLMMPPPMILVESPSFTVTPKS